MTKFDLDEIRTFTADVDARMTRCDNGEGMECATLDAKLRHYAQLCWDVRSTVRAWWEAVFSGRVACDPDVNKALYDKADQLYERASDLLIFNEAQAVGPCAPCDGHAVLGSALWWLKHLLDHWIIPKKAVGPAARHVPNPDQAALAETKRAIESLPGLPADWQPADPEQQKRYAMLREHHGS